MNFAQSEHIDKGYLKFHITEADGYLPIQGASIAISYTGDPDSILETIQTDENGQTERLTLPAPPIDYSMEPGEQQPYAEYTFHISAPDHDPVTIAGSEILPEVTAIQETSLPLLTDPVPDIVYTIGAHTLYGNYPPKIPEAEIKPIEETGEIVLSRVVIPEYIIVHDGSINDRTAKDYYVKYKDYIKNVASCEIYATWPRATIEANVLAIMSFTLNRVYTEWYRNKGYDFTITSSTAYDHKWIPEKNTYTSINEVVDQIFSDYLSRPNVSQPILTQYCDGKKVSCSGWMSKCCTKPIFSTDGTMYRLLNR